MVAMKISRVKLVPLVENWNNRRDKASMNHALPHCFSARHFNDRRDLKLASPSEDREPEQETVVRVTFSYNLLRLRIFTYANTLKPDKSNEEEKETANICSVHSRVYFRFRNKKATTSTKIHQLR